MDKGGRTGFHSGYTERRGSATEFPCQLSLCIAPLANGNSEDDAAGDSEHQALEATCLKALLICRASHSVLGSGVMVQLMLRSQVLSESAGNLPL